jgi:lipooligosaccharide transport system permease protein
MALAARVMQRKLLVYRRTWRGSLFFSFLQPIMFLAAMGIGVGALVDPGTLSTPSYAHFVGPGLLAATAMQAATFEATYPIMNRIMWGKNYEAMLATPVRIRELVIGELGWIGAREVSIGLIFLVVLTAVGITESPLAVLAVPVAVLTGLGFAAWLIAFTARQRNDVGFSAIFRFVINPLFIFSGTFFPLPDPLLPVAWLTPLFHAAELMRGLFLGTLAALPAVAHLTYLMVFFAVGAWLADRSMHRRLAV